MVSQTSSSIDHCHRSFFSIGNRRIVQSTIYSNRLVSSLSLVAINNALVLAQWPPSRNLIALDRDSVANSRDVYAFKSGLRAGSRSAFTCTDSMIVRKEAVYVVS